MDNQDLLQEDLAFSVIIGFFEVGSIVGILAAIFGLPLVFWITM